MLRGPLRAALPSLRDLPSETRSVSAAHSVNERCFVDDEKAVVEAVGLNLVDGAIFNRKSESFCAIAADEEVWHHGKAGI